jgi:hypothetical protein
LAAIAPAIAAQEVSALATGFAPRSAKLLVHQNVVTRANAAKHSAFGQDFEHLSMQEIRHLQRGVRRSPPRDQSSTDDMPSSNLASTGEAVLVKTDVAIQTDCTLQNMNVITQEQVAEWIQAHVHSALPAHGGQFSVAELKAKFEPAVMASAICTASIGSATSEDEVFANPASLPGSSRSIGVGTSRPLRHSTSSQAAPSTSDGACQSKSAWAAVLQPRLDRLGATDMPIANIAKGDFFILLHDVTTVNLPISIVVPAGSRGVVRNIDSDGDLHADIPAAVFHSGMCGGVVLSRDDVHHLAALLPPD